MTNFKYIARLTEYGDVLAEVKGRSHLGVRQAVIYAQAYEYSSEVGCGIEEAIRDVEADIEAGLLTCEVEKLDPRK